MNDFDYDVLQKKRLAQQAKYRKNGSKSKKCPLSTDHMTQKQWKERCGETMTYQLGRPMVWDDFRKLPIHIQKEYLLGLIRKYSTTASDLATMFGIAPQTVTKFCGCDEIGIKFTRGKRMPKNLREEFEKFMACDLLQEEKQIIDDPLPRDEANISDVKHSVDVNDMSKSKRMAMTEFSLCFNGKFSRDMICNSLASMVPAGTEVCIDVKCSIVS